MSQAVPVTVQAQGPARRVDHVVMPVHSLETARRRYEALGLTVAPDGRHPFGTANCCVHFADGAYLEPLAIAHRETAEAAARAGNGFVRFDQTWRFRNQGEGLSALALSSRDAAADGARFAAAGWRGSEVLSFQRQNAGPDAPSFRLAFADDPRSPSLLGFTCERSSAVPPAPHHPCTAVGLSAVVLVEDNPSDFQYWLQSLVDTRDVDAHSFGMSLQAGPTRVDVLTPPGFDTWFGGRVTAGERGLRGAAIVIAVASLDACARSLQGNGVSASERHGRLVIAPADGQGVIVAFEERP